jgi:hypothetical protein
VCQGTILPLPCHDCFRYRLKCSVDGARTPLTLSTYAQVAEFLRFNGPARSTDSCALASDLKIMSMILKSKASSNSTGSSSSKSDSDQTVHLNGHMNSTEISNSSSKSKTEKELSSSDDSAGSKVEKEAVRFSLSSKCLVEQLPNTLSVSFRGISHPFLSALPVHSLLISSYLKYKQVILTHLQPPTK